MRVAFSPRTTTGSTGSAVAQVSVSVAFSPASEERPCCLLPSPEEFDLSIPPAAACGRNVRPSALVLLPLPHSLTCSTAAIHPTRLGCMWTTFRCRRRTLTKIRKIVLPKKATSDLASAEQGECRYRWQERTVVAREALNSF